MQQPGRRRMGAVSRLVHPPSPPTDELIRFADRHDAGRQLAGQLERYRGDDPVVVGIPRGGVPVAAEVAHALGAPLDVLVVRKVGAPGNPEYGIGALAEGDVRIVSDEAVRAIGLSAAQVEALVGRAQSELADRLSRFRADHPPLPLAGRTVLLVDDGLATGRTARAAALALRRRGAARIVLAVPVAAPSSVDDLRGDVDDVVCVEQPQDLWAVGSWYDDFRPTSDAEVARLLAEAGAATTVVSEVTVEADSGVLLPGDLTLPAAPRGIVAFAHGSGSSRLSPRNRAVAQALDAAGFATLLFDLLTPREERDRSNVFDIPLLARRLLAATRWLRAEPRTRALPIGYFGASTGAAAALVAAAEAGPEVRAVVSRGGRPDLAGRWLPLVVAPTLLVVGGADWEVLELNREAQRRLRCLSRLEIVRGATHLFEEPGALEDVAQLAISWFGEHLEGGGARTSRAPIAGRAT